MSTTKEKQIEEDFISKLRDMKYVYRDDIRDKTSLDRNFREKFQALNRVNLSDKEFEKLMRDIISNDVFTAAKTLRQKSTFTREDGTPLHYTLVNIDDWCKNDFEVINQLRINTENSHHRFDVILLINGIPFVQVELKSLEIQTRRAMEQIVDYKNDPGNGYTNTLLCFIQLFIVSNQSKTYYFANNHTKHFSFNADERFLPIYQLANEKNQKIANLHDFADHLLGKCTIAQLVNRYMVLVASEQKLMIMRPYQIYAVQAIVDCIEQNRGNGFIWHTTGSGKTLTSFKAATLLKQNTDIEKCLFVVDRKDLDRQTREEFNRFQEGSVEENTNTETLVERLLSDSYADKVIVTTIQKLGLALDENSKRNKQRKKDGEQTYKQRLEPLSNKRVVFIFDECHRSQFGENHKAIKEFFPQSQLFGFTGTPIFEKNASLRQVEGKEQTLLTTEDVFQNELHSYTITEAILDRNVLRFYVEHFKPEGTDKIKPGDTLAKQAVVDAILKKHHASTDSRRFNAVFATASINDAIEYVELFKEVQAAKLAENPAYTTLNIACVFSPPATISPEINKDIKQLQQGLDQEREDNKQNPEEKKAALKVILADYNTQYGTNFDINTFDLYYQDVQQRIKDQKYSNTDYPQKNKIDIVIVVDMLLTGFDSKHLSTLYVDKNLKTHGLIQAFSRTNRVLNGTKPFGNIVDFRGLEDAVEESIELFSGQAEGEERRIWLVDPAPVVVEHLADAVQRLQDFMQSQGVAATPDQVANLKGDNARAEFTNCFKEVQRIKKQLDQYTDLSEESKQQIEALIPTDTLRSFTGVYLETAQELKALQDKGADDHEPNPVIDNLDFEFVLFSSAIIDYDYIMELIADSTQSSPQEEEMSRDKVIGMIESNSNFNSERALIKEYVLSLDKEQSFTRQEIHDGYNDFKKAKSQRAVAQMAVANGLELDALQFFVDETLSLMRFDGDRLTDLFRPQELGWKDRIKAEQALLDDLIPHLKHHAQEREISGLKHYEE